MSTTDRFTVGCEGELIDTFPDAASALNFARVTADALDTPHEIFDAATHTCLAIVEPLRAA